MTITTNIQPTVEDLLSQATDTPDHHLAARYAPIIHFDNREPFLPAAVGYTIFRENGPSPSFPRYIDLAEVGSTFAIEYAVWWDWDIQHLYELEHIWVFVNAQGQVVHGEASWHGGYHPMTVDGQLNLSGDRLIVLSEPGKHAFAPTVDWLTERADHTRRCCTSDAGKGGLLVTDLYEGLILSKTPQADRLAHTYLERHVFEPTMIFDQIFPISAAILTPWPLLSAWIPPRIAGIVAHLAQIIPPAERRIIRIGHRGASAHAPENTLAAFVKAAELGADMVELDLQLSADGIPVVIHDADLSRATNGSGSVAHHTLAQLKQLDAGNGEQIPTLSEAVDCCRKHHLGIYFEIKSGGTIRPLVELLTQQKLYHGVIVASFRADWVAQVKELNPKLKTSILFGATSLDAVKLAQAVQADYVHPCWENAAPEPHKLLTADWINRVREANLGIICWHEERPTEIAALLQLGVDGICSDAPERLR